MFGFGNPSSFSFPTRGKSSGLTSGGVQSDDEFNMSWQNKLASIPQTMTGMSAPVQILPGSADYDAKAAQPWHNEIANSQWNNLLSGAGSSVNQDKLRQAFDTAQASGLTLQAGNQGNNFLASGVSNMGAQMVGGYDANALDRESGLDNWTISLNPYSADSAGAMKYGQPEVGSHTVSEVQSYANPEYLMAKANFDQASKERGENQTRQQQAYNTFLAGDGQIGGVMPSNYSDPSYGQVSGQSPSASTTGIPGFGGLSGADLTGIDNSMMTGNYMGGAGRYNPSPFSPAAFQNRNPWAGL